MTRKIIDWGAWLRAIPQATTFFGLAMIALVWGAVEFNLNAEFERSRSASLQSTDNLARLFEDNIIRTIKTNDRILRSLQLSSVNETLTQDFARLSAEIDGAGDFTTVLSLVDADGRLTATSYGPVPEYTSVSDRDYFKAHRDNPELGLFIGKPVINRVSGKRVIQLTRPLRGPHGAFAGIAIASLNTDRLVKFYETVDLGSEGAISLTGFDGIIRAAAGMRIDAVGRSMQHSELLRRIGVADEGSYTSNGIVDGVTRLISYRVVEGFPLAVWVGQAERYIYRNYWSNAYAYRTIASGLTFFIAIVVFLNIRHLKGLESARRELHASEALAREKSRELALTLDHMSQGIMMIDGDEKVALMNRRAVELLGLDEEFVASRPRFEDLVAQQWSSGEFGLDGEAIDPNIRKSIRAGLSVPILNNYERTRPDGTVLEVRSVHLPDGGFVRTFTDITDRKRNEDKIAHMAHHDPLTALANRLLLRDRIDMAFAQQRRSGECFALLLIDLDRFKAVNDSLGHAAGDTLLKMVAQRLKACVRDVDTIARLGGDEFAILQCGTANREGIEVLARRVVEVIGAPYSIDGAQAVIGASIGIARSYDNSDLEQLFRNADLALYSVKSEGRNGFRLFEVEMDVAARERRQLEVDLHQARDRGEFEIHYQPITSLSTGRVVGVEALLRWNHPLRGQMSPADFIPVAEEIGAMTEIDSWVLETACAEAMRWPADMSVAVNLSPTTFKRRTLADIVCRTLQATGLAPARLELEISERVLLQEEEANLVALHALRDLGVQIALDDFGVGHSSLSDLRAFHFDKIKIDQSFVREMENRHECAAIVAAIAGLGRSLGTETTAEGVETETQAELVRAAGCTQAQGYLYSRPVSASRILTLLCEPPAKQAVA